MIDKIYIQYKKNVDKGINPMDFLMSLDNRIVMSVEFENDFINKRGGQKGITNTKTYWYGEEIGIMHQPFVTL